MHILGISGSLRMQSLNTASLHACMDWLPPGLSMEIFDIPAIPPYNEDTPEQGFSAPSRFHADGKLTYVARAGHIIKMLVVWTQKVGLKTPEAPAD